MAPSRPVLTVDYPDAARRLRELFATDAQFVQLSEQLEGVNRQIEAGQAGDDPASVALDTVLRRQRQMLKTALHVRLSVAFSGSDDDRREIF